MCYKWIFYCDVCDKFIKPKRKYEHFQSNVHKEFDICKHVELTIQNLDKNNVDEVFYTYNNQHNKQYDYYLVKCHLIFIFKDNQHNTWTKSNLFDTKTMICGKKIYKM